MIKNKDELLKFLLYEQNNEIYVGIVCEIDISDGLEPEFKKEIIELIKSEIKER